MTVRPDPSTERDGPDADLPSTVVRRTLFLASQPRSGSTLLSRALWDTGLCGRPWEYLGALHIAAFRSRWAAPYGRRSPVGVVARAEKGVRRLFGAPWTAGVSVGLARWTAADVRDHLARVTALRTTGNGVFGVKAHFEQVSTILLERGLSPEDLWPDVRFVWLVRRDAVRQAVSFARARQTAAWTGDTSASRAPRYHREDVARALADIARWDRDWGAFFAPRSPPLRLVYEDVAANLEGALAAVFTHLDLPAPPTWPSPALRVQADADTDAWCDAYRAGQ